MEEDNVSRLIQLFKWTAEYSLDLGNVTKALKYLQLSRKIQLKHYGRSSLELLETDIELATCFNAAGHPTSDVMKNLDGRRAHFKIKASKPSSNACYGLLAQAKLLVGKKNEALKLFKEAVDNRSELFGPEAPFTIVAKYRHLKTLAEMSKPGEYTSELQEMYKVLRIALGPSHETTEDMMRVFAVDLQKQGRKKESFQLFKAQAVLDYPKMEEEMSKFTAHVLMSAAFLKKGLKKESVDVMKEGYDLSQKMRASYAVLGASLLAGLLKQVNSKIMDNLILDIEGCSNPEMVDVHRRMNIWFRDVYPSLQTTKKASKDEKTLKQASVTDKDAQKNLNDSFDIKFNQAKKLMEDFKYDEAFRCLMTIYDEQAKVLGPAHQAAVDTLKTFDCWELRPEFVSHPVLVEAYKFLERIIPKIRAASSSVIREHWFYQLQWRQGYLMSKAEDCCPAKASQVCAEAYKQKAMNTEGEDYGLFCWEDAERTDGLLFLATFMPIIEELLQGREKILYQALVQVDHARNGCIRGSLKTLINLYQTVVNELKIDDPLLVSLLQNIYELYEMIPDRKSLGEEVNFFKSKLLHFKHKLGPDHPLTLTVQEIFSCSLVKWTTERPKLKQDLVNVIEETAEKTSRVLGENHLVTIKAKENLSAIIMSDVFGNGDVPRPGMFERLAELEQLVNNTYNAYVQLYGKEHPKYWNQCLVLSNLYIGPLLKTDRALELAKEAYTGLCKRYGKNSEEAASAETFISEVMRKKDKRRVLDLSGFRF